MKNKNTRFKSLFFIIPLVLCLTFVLLFSPKIKSFFQDNNGSYSQKEEENIKYRLVYSKKFTIYDRNAALISKAYNNNLVDGYLKKIVSQFEGQDVYFRVKVSPVIFIEEKEQEDYSDEKRKELLEQRIERVKEMGAMDMVLVPDESFVYYATVNAEMIKKIDSADECFLYLVAVPNPNDYPYVEDNIIVINVTEGMEIPL